VCACAVHVCVVRARVCVGVRVCDWNLCVCACAVHVCVRTCACLYVFLILI